MQNALQVAFGDPSVGGEVVSASTTFCPHLAADAAGKWSVREPASYPPSSVQLTTRWGHGIE